MTILIQELLSLKEAKTTYQFRIDNHPWEDISFERIDSLQQLADEINDPGFDGSKVFAAIPELHAKMVEYHGGNHSEVFDVVDEDYEVTSFAHDVLKISYEFMIRYKKYTKEPRDVKGTISFMDEN